MTMAIQSLATALKSSEVRRGLSQLVGCPVGNCGQTEQAARNLYDYIPCRSLRAYTVQELIDAALIEAGGHWAWRA